MRFVIFLVLAAGLMVSGCGMVNPITAVQLARLNPLEADPADIAVQVVLPDGVGIVSESAGLVLSATSGAGETISGFYPLHLLPGDVWQVAEADHARLRADQAQILTWESADPDGTNGSLTVGFEPCALGGGPTEAARVTVRLRIEPDGDFLPLLSNVPVAQLYDQADIAGLSACN